LPESTAKTLSIAAAIGSIVDVDLLQSLINRNNDFEFFDILDDLIGREILRETGKPRVLAFAHDLLREAALSNLTATRRQGIHQAIGEVLEKRLAGGESVTFAALAEHFLASHCNEKAFHYLLKAGSQATDTFAHVDAIPLLEQAKLIMPSDTKKEDQFALLECLGRSFTAQDRGEDSLREFQLALDAADDAFHRSMAHYGIGKCHLRVAKIAEGREHFEKALALLGEPQPKSTAGYLFGMFLYGTDFQFRPKWVRWKTKPTANEQMRDLASEIYFSHCMIVVQTDLFAYLYSSIQNARLAKHSDSSDAIALAYSKYAFNLSLSGAIGQLLSKPYIRESNARLSRCKSVFVKALTLQNIGGSAYYSGDLDSAEQYFVELHPELDKTNDWHVGWNIHMQRHIASQRGDSAKIIEHSRHEIEFGEKIKDPIFRAFGLFGLADGLSRSGKFEEAVACGRESIALVENMLTRSVAMQELGRALIQASNYEEAETTLAKSLKCLQKDLFYFDFAIQNFSLYPEAIVGPHWSQGPKFVPKAKRNKATWAAMKGRFWALSFPNMRAHTLRVSGRVAAACGKTHRAIRYFDKALVAAKKFGNRGEYARTLIDKSRILKDDAAKKCIEEGLRIMNELGSVLPASDLEVIGIQNQPIGKPTSRL